MAAVDEERRLRGVILVIERAAALRVLAVGHGLEQRRHGGAQQFRQMGAGLELADLAPDQLAPALADALADEAVQDTLDIYAGRVGNGLHRGSRLLDGERVVDGKPQAYVVHGIARLHHAAAAVVLDKGFCVDQPRLDFPEAVVAKIAQALDRAAVHEAALVFRLVLVRRGHRDSQWNGCRNPKPSQAPKSTSAGGTPASVPRTKTELHRDGGGCRRRPLHLTARAACNTDRPG